MLPSIDKLCPHAQSFNQFSHTCLFLNRSTAPGVINDLRKACNVNNRDQKKKVNRTKITLGRKRVACSKQIGRAGEENLKKKQKTKKHQTRKTLSLIFPEMYKKILHVYDKNGMLFF